ncbi:hypothetical protein PTRA_a1281 [Pseudoalteromonas translucida KMM 520]|uniref:Uncharacterized protein n=1 Tax=Pseudoalteromonas translucida KMM 520 TaxID=1315283 RepID=A0A0U2WBQ7_9GAMM|nr:hypothetical protein PTRA_a1281 [Pseudoalteromonas translucida KMM 520]
MSGARILFHLTLHKNFRKLSNILGNLLKLCRDELAIANKYAICTLLNC